MAYNLFKGYVRINEAKESIDKYKNVKNLKTRREVQDYNGFAGVLNEYTILIDVDDKEQSDILFKIVQEKKLKCKVIETTRGKHFYFKNKDVDKCGTHIKLACGIEADIKTGKKATIGVLKFNGIERKEIYNILEDEDYDFVPKYLTPVKTNVDFFNLKEGDGRNQTLFNYILTLQSNDFTVEESRECLTVINNFVFKDKLPEEELNTIMRDDAFNKQSFYNGKKFLFEEFAIFLKNHSHIIKLNGLLYIYDEGIYKTGQELIENKMIEFIKNLTSANRTEVYKYLNILIKDNSTVSPANYIAFKNGVYDIITKELLEFSPNFILTNKINYNYNPNAESELVEKTLNKLACQDQEIKNLLEECIGYCFYRRNELGKAFILTGMKANGKSTFLDMIKNVLGEDNITSLDLQEFTNEYKVAELNQRLANIGDDISDNFIPDSSLFKKLVTGDRITARKIYCPPFEFNNYAKMLFSANNIPRIKDSTGAVQRRLIIIPFNATFSKKDPDYDPYIKYKLKTEECMEYLIKIGVEGLIRVIENKEFSYSSQAEKELVDYEELNNPLVGFFKGDEDVDIEKKTIPELYNLYVQYCLANGIKDILCAPVFSKETKRTFNFDIIQKYNKGKPIKFFKKKK